MKSSNPSKLIDHWPTVTPGGKKTVSKSKAKKSEKRASGSLERLWLADDEL